MTEYLYLILLFWCVSFTLQISLKKTLRSIQQHKNGPQIVDATDPDAPFRQHKKWEAEDTEEEQSLLMYLWQFIRCGELAKAIELCRKFKQFWRAAALSGGALWHDEQKIDQIGAVWGNRKRFLWKQACTKLSVQEGSSVCEQAIFGALGGNLSRVIPNCKTWEDQAWAYFKTMVDTTVDQKLSSHWMSRPDVNKTHFQSFANSSSPAGICADAESVFKRLDSDHRMRYLTPDLASCGHCQCRRV